MTSERVDRRARLEVVSGPAAGRRVEVGAEPLEIGREANGTGKLDDAQLSRRHARISSFGNGELLVEDLGSTNGTWVNGGQVAGPTVVRAGDTVELGDTILRVVPPSVAVHGGVHAVPGDLVSVLAARAPVKLEWIVRAALIALPIVFLTNLAIRTFAVELLDVDPDLPPMRLYSLVIITVMPTLGNCVGFYMNFGRPEDHHTVRYLIPTFGITLFIVVVWSILLPAGAGATEYLVTFILIVVAPTVVVPTLLALRVRAALEEQQRLRPSAGV